MKVSVVICTYNREELLVNTLKSVFNQSYANIEVLVVDQTEEHEHVTNEYLTSINDKIKLINQSPSLTKARNRALHEASGDIIIFIDDDVLLCTDFIAEHVAAHMAGYTVVQGRVIEDKDKGKTPAEKPQFFNRMVKCTGRNDCLSIGETNTLTGCNFSISREVIKRVGYFDEFFQGLAIREDADYGIRCYKASEKMIFWPKAELEHLRSNIGGVDTGISNHFFSESYYKNELYFVKKHFSPLVVYIYKLRLLRRSQKNLKRLLAQLSKNS